MALERRVRASCVRQGREEAPRGGRESSISTNGRGAPPPLFLLLLLPLLVVVVVVVLLVLLVLLLVVVVLLLLLLPPRQPAAATTAAASTAAAGGGGGGAAAAAAAAAAGGPLTSKRVMASEYTSDAGLTGAVSPSTSGAHQLAITPGRVRWGGVSP